MTDLRDKIKATIMDAWESYDITDDMDVIADRILTLLATESEAVSQYLASVEAPDRLEDFEPLPERLTDPEQQKRDWGKWIET